MNNNTQSLNVFFFFFHRELGPHTSLVFVKKIDFSCTNCPPFVSYELPKIWLCSLQNPTSTLSQTEAHVVCDLWTFRGSKFPLHFFFFLSHPRASSTFCSHKAFIGFLFCWFVPSLYCIIENIHCLLVFGIWASVSAYCPTGDISSEKSIIQEFFFFLFPPVRSLSFVVYPSAFLWIL